MVEADEDWANNARNTDTLVIVPVFATAVSIDDTSAEECGMRDEAKISRPSAAPSLRRWALLNSLVFVGLALSHSDMCTQAAAAAAPVQATQHHQQQQQANSQELENAVPDAVRPGLFQNEGEQFDLVEVTNRHHDHHQHHHQHGESSFDFDEEEESYDNGSKARFEPKNDIFIVAAVDGTLAGIDGQSGHVIWKQAGGGSRDVYKTREPDTSHRDSESMKLPRHKPETKAGSLLEPLLATTTTAKNSKMSSKPDSSKTVAIPSVDGSVYLTTVGSARGNSRPGDTSTVTASVRELVSRAPFVDTTGRFYVGSRYATVAALDGDTGEILQVAAADDHHLDNNPSKKKAAEPDWQDRNVVWIGRVDYSVSVYNARTSAKEAQFASSEMMGINDMVGDIPSSASTTPSYSQYQDMFLSERAPNLMFSSNSDSEDGGNTYVEATSTPRFAQLVTTPNGNLAFRDPETGNVAWVADQPFDTPIIFAIQSSTGSSMAVDIIPDVPRPSQSMEYLRYELERQIEATMYYDRLLDDASDLGVDNESGPTSSGSNNPNWKNDETRVPIHPPVMGALLSGELYAMPLGTRKGVHKDCSNGVSAIHRHSQASSTSSASLGAKHSLSKVPLIAGRFPGHHPDGKHGTGPAKAMCGPSTPTFPSCIFKGVLQRLDLLQNNNAPPGTDTSLATVEKPLRRHTLQNIDGVVGPMDCHRDYDYVPAGGNGWNQEEQKRQRKQRKLLRILGSWLPPTIALIFVVSFELGRRKRQKDALSGLQHIDGNVTDYNDVLRSADEKAFPVADAPAREVIQVTDQVLGYGGHGTVVFRGTLEGRNVAVKRMLKTYLASADREISLLIESDGHPNVVRYFLKEIRGDFVYLALELCDISLQTLIGTLCGVSQNGGSVGPVLDQSALPAAKEIVLQIATGVHHLHSLRIVHRDLKPANILLAITKKTNAADRDSSTEFVYQTFLEGNYTAKISDMGLGKMLAGQSSFGGSTLADPSFRGPSNGGNANAVASIGPGTTGWQAPECMAIRQTPRNKNSSDMSNSGDASPLETSNSSSSRISRSADIFSLGCIFYSVLVPGSHPFGEWYEREANIMHNRPCIDKLKELSVEAFDLISSMIQRNPRNRPTAKHICDHPFFWCLQRKLSFICDLSDRLETDTMASCVEAGMMSLFALNPLAIERNATQVVGTAWDKVLYDDLISNVQRFRAYDPCSIRDLLRLIRNKHHHYDELPAEVRQKVGSNTDGLMQYFERCFPKLLLHCYKACEVLLPPDDPLVQKYSITAHIIKTSKEPPIALAPPNAASSTIEAMSVDSSGEDLKPSTQVSFDSQDVPVSTSTATNASQSDPLSDSLVGHSDAGSLPEKVVAGCDTTETDRELSTETKAGDDEHTVDDAQHLLLARGNDLELENNPGGIIIWEGSTAAKKFNSRGWIRSDEDWARRAAGGRQRNANLMRCADDPKFRTRLCNHWDESLGTFCPMRKKNKCVFAHGPVELRVKEGKRHRWGKLVDKNGDSANLNHSGGEDTYGAARSIESTRKEEGKWSTKSQNRPKKQTTSKKKSQS